MHFDIADMQLFIKVADAGSLTQAAKDRARSPSAASARLKSLESQLGARLFYREPNGLSLTAAGIDFLSHAKKIVSEYELTKRRFQNQHYSAAEHLRIIANSASTSEIIPGILLELLNQDPNITVDVQQKNTHQSIRSILDNEADIAMVAGSDDFSNVNSILFATDYLAIATPNHHPLLDAPQKNLKEISKYPMLSTSSTTLLDFLNEKFQAINSKANYRILLDGFEPIIRLVEANAGIAILPESVTVRYREKFNFSFVRIEEEWALRERRIIFSNIEFLSPCARKLINIIIRKYLQAEPEDQTIEHYLEQRAVHIAA
ncbi:hypothetical protein W822_02190 [Advenella kashmirensis W13003]|uniref:HTH lysR-type domain-containing protein n=1 Tax=Advenella kashmirensis W13003 TaxID=1424334 RepID=V8QZD8_9BURK|nr:LysR family transcriptional regulator [Advenella kashmirensis]ETF04680.1 hypothetical protein W822_02190 [Advenella kashmirensis W13003]